MNAENTAPVTADPHAPISLDDLVARAQASLSGTVNERDAALGALYARVRPTLRWIAKSIPQIGSQSVDDLVQQGAMMVVRRIGSFDPSRGAFKGWLRINARAEMIAFSEQHASDVQMSEGARRGRTKTPGGVVFRPFSLDVPKPATGIDSSDAGDASPANEVVEAAVALEMQEERSSWGADAQLEEHERNIVLRRAVFKLSPQHRELICWAYGIDRPEASMRAIADQLGVARSKAAKMLVVAQEALKVALADAGVEGL